jgi:hypothetical protein
MRPTLPHILPAARSPEAERLEREAIYSTPTCAVVKDVCTETSTLVCFLGLVPKHGDSLK